MTNWECFLIKLFLSIKIPTPSLNTVENANPLCFQNSGSRYIENKFNRRFKKTTINPILTGVFTSWIE